MRAGAGHPATPTQDVDIAESCFENAHRYVARRLNGSPSIKPALTVMLAFAQLGITACTFLLGAITKPAIDYALAPVFEQWGLPYVLADIIAFMLALIVVTFHHLVIREMAPKSWAIAHPETAAKATGILPCTLTWPLRPVLLWINHIANRLVQASGVEPVKRAAAGGQDADTIWQLVAHSCAAGTLEEQYSEPIVRAIALNTLTVGDIVRTDRTRASVAADATVAELQRLAAASSHLRILVGAGASSRVAHVRDTLTASPDAAASDIARDALVISPETSAYDALARMRRDSVQLATVVDKGRLLGVVTLDDLLREILPASKSTTV